MFKWKKLGRIFNPVDLKDKPSWMQSHAQGPNTILFDDFVRVYFCCRPKKEEKGQFVSYCTFLDLDRKDLTKVINIAKEPVMPLGELGTFDEFGTYPVSAIRYESLISAIRYESLILLYYGGWTRCVSVPFNVSLGLAISEDNGYTFIKAKGNGPVLSHSRNEPFVEGSPKIRKYGMLWYLFYVSGRKWILHNNRPEVIYKIRMAWSSDLTAWTKYNRNIIGNVFGENECQAGPDVFFYKDKYHMFFSYRQGLDFRNTRERGYRIGYAYSDNLFDWTRDDSKAGMFFSENNWDWDCNMHHYPHVFEVDDRIYMLYNGNDFGKFGFGLAELEES